MLVSDDSVLRNNHRSHSAAGVQSFDFCFGQVRNVERDPFRPM